MVSVGQEAFADGVVRSRNEYPGQATTPFTPVMPGGSSRAQLPAVGQATVNNQGKAANVCPSVPNDFSPFMDNSKKLERNLCDASFGTFNNNGHFMPPAPFRAAHSNLDPCSGFMSPAGELLSNSGRSRIPTMVQLNTTPQSYNPKNMHSIRMNDTAPPDNQRYTDKDPGNPYDWNSRRVSDSSLRAKLGGWTSSRDPRKEEEFRLRGNKAKTGVETARDVRDKLATKFMYTSSSQRGYEEVPWESMLNGGRGWTHTTTFEKRPDMISHRFNVNNRYEPLANEWQNVGRSWDWFQRRENNYNTIEDLNFTTHSRKAQQIPGYAGCIGGDTILEINKSTTPFTPYTVKRNPVPWVTDTAHRPNIPRYEGSTLYTEQRINNPMHSLEPYPTPATTARVHCYMPLNSMDTGLASQKSAHLAKMVTTVPPSNPFNRIESKGVYFDQPHAIDVGRQSHNNLTNLSVPSAS